MDLISQLPESIAHRILSSLVPLHFCLRPPVDLVRMSVLSKTWFDLTASFSDLVFEVYKFRCRESFFKYVEYTTSRFCQKNVPAHTFRLTTGLRNPAEFDIAKRCVELVLKKGVTVLIVEMIDLHEFGSSSNPMPKYRLPDILLSVSVLSSLTLHHCELPSSLMVDAVKFKSLIMLKLVDVRVDDEVIKYLTTSCPLLQELKIQSCYGFKRFCVYGHPHLQQVRIEYDTPVEIIDIEAPNLSYLWIQDKDYKGAPHMNFASCKKLTTVSYGGHGHPLPNHFLSNFPYIENLHLGTDDTCNNLKWSSLSLRTLVLESDCHLGEIELNTPNLDLFIYGLAWRMVTDNRWPLLRDSTNMKSCMQCYPDCVVEVLWFQRLRQFLEKKNGFKALNVHIHSIYSQHVIKLEKLNEIKLPPYKLEYVELQLDTYEESSGHMAFVDALLWCCCPQHLTLRSFFPITDFEDVVRFVSEKLLQQEDQGHTNIQIVSCPEGKTISFIKKEVVKEEAG